MWASNLTRMLGGEIIQIQAFSSFILLWWSCTTAVEKALSGSRYDRVKVPAEHTCTGSAGSVWECLYIGFNSGMSREISKQCADLVKGQHVSKKSVYQILGKVFLQQWCWAVITLMFLNLDIILKDNMTINSVSWTSLRREKKISEHKQREYYVC